MPDDLFRVWVYLQATPLLALTLTIGTYIMAVRLQMRLKGNALLNPVLVAVVLLVGLLLATDFSYGEYFEGAQFVHFMLGPATVALAVPLYTQLPRLRVAWKALGLGLLAGSLTAVLTAVGLAWGAGAAPEIVRSLASKSVTAPIAMALAENLGGEPSLTAVCVILTGVVGAVLGPRLLDIARVHDPRARGLAMGTAAHGIGTARAFQEDNVTGAFSGLAMGLNGLLTALLLGLAAYLLV